MISPVRNARYLLGVDGGGSGCRARLTDLHGHVLGQGSAGPANLALGIDLAVAAVLQAAQAALAQAGLGPTALAHTAAGLGMAAGNVPHHRHALLQARLPFAAFEAASDAEAACVGAHAGADGAVLILGTGSQGVVCRDGVFTTVGGWGFMLADQGSGAALGRMAVRHALLSYEGVLSPSPLTRRILQRFEDDPEQMLQWAGSARPRDWAGFAHMVFEHASAHDPAAVTLVRRSTQAVELLLDRLVALGAARAALMGGVSSATRPYLDRRFDSLIVQPLGDAMDGALVMARRAAGLARIVSVSARPELHEHSRADQNGQTSKET